MRQRLLVPWFLTLSLLLAACSDSPVSPEDEIRQFIATGIAAGEARELGDLMDLVEANYLDGQGYTRKRLGDMLRLYFFRNKNIYLFSKIGEIELISVSEAQVTLHVAMASSAISDASMLPSLRARVYRFEFNLVKDEAWLLRSANWRRAAFGDMQ